MEDREEPSWAIRIFGPLLFILAAIGALLWFFVKVFYLFKAGSSEIVVFDKGSFYMLGVGVGLLALSFAGVQETWLKKPLSEKNASSITKMAIVGLILTFTMPHLIHYISSNALQKQGYSICEEASSQWLFVSNTVYVKESIECNGSLKNK